MDNEVGSFKFEKISNFKSSIYSVKVSNKNVIAVTKNILLRFSVDNPNSLEEIKIPSEEDLAHNIFLDPTSNHVIVSMQSGHSFYLHKTSKKFRAIKEAKGFLIESIGWNTKQCSESCTGFILLGTFTGELIETKFTNTALTADHWKVIHKLDQSINGIIFDSYPHSLNSKYFLIITTATNIYPRFFDLSYVPKGTPLFSTEFEKINQFPAGSKCTTFPMEFGYSHLDFYYPKNELFPEFLAWMNGAGVYWSKIHRNPADAVSNLFNRPKLLQYSKEMKSSVPICVATSQFHVILQCSNLIDFICTINEEKVYSFSIDKLGKEKALGLCKDRTSGLIYLFTNRNIYLINCEDETKTLWRTFANQKNYALAYEYCNNEAEKNSIRIKQAEALYKEQKYTDAAFLYADTDTLFEETVSLFTDLDSKAPLKKYLLTLNTKSISVNPKLKNTFDVINMWLLELFFEEIIGHSFETGIDVTNEALKVIDPDYKTFVDDPNINNSLKRNKRLIYEKIKIYGDSTQSAIFAEIIKDREKMLENQIDRGNFKEALKMLAVEKSPTVHYRYGARVIASLPEELCDLWISMSSKLDPKKILPIIRKIPDEIAKRYAQHVIENMTCDYEEVHNFYILVCARLEGVVGRSPRRRDLIEYLEAHGHKIHEVKYDATLALRISIEYKNTEGAVFLYCMLNKHKEAVELALKEKNVDLAKKVVSRFFGPEEVKKHLWLQIAHFIIIEQEDIQEACQLVKTESVLRLEDILPCFPDYVKIEQFSEAICNSLDYYESHMNNLKADMRMSTDYAEKNREEINLLKQKPIIIPEGAVCAFCGELLTARVFCAFSCRHNFHMHCLEQVVEPMLPGDRRARLVDLKDRFAHTTYDDLDLKRDLHDLVAADCCFCGSLAVDCVDVPVISFQEFEAEMALWR